MDELHAKGVRVIGRLVCFRDPIHAQAAWRAGRRDEVIQTPGGQAYSGYGGFTNFADPEVRKYNIDVAVAAAKLGVDEILYDYVRRPDGPLSSMRFPGLTGSPEQAIVEFLEQSRKALAGTDALLGASVFGVAATRPEEVAQDIPAMARTVDYIAPMVYPSHWGPGEYNVANPNGEPYAITRRSLADFARKTRFTGARVVPWLQDFSLGVRLRPGRGARPDPGRAGRGHGRVHPLGPGGHVHLGRARRRRRSAPRSPCGRRRPKACPGRGACRTRRRRRLRRASSRPSAR